MTSKQRRRSMNLAFIGAIFTLVGISCVGGGVITLVALKLGAGEIYLGVLSFIQVAAWSFRAFTLSAVERHGKRKVMILWKTASIVFIIPLMFLPFLVTRWTPAACLGLILAATFLRSAMYALGNSGWFPLLQDIVPPRVTGRFFANLRISWQTSRLITLLAIAWFIGKDSAWWKFEVVFIIGLIAFLLRSLSFIGMTENHNSSTMMHKLTIPQRFKEVLKQKQLARLILYISIYYIAAMMTEPFKIKFLKDLGYSDGFILTATAIISLGAIVSLRFWGKLADKFGNGPIFTISHIAMPLVTIPWLWVGKDSGVLVFALFFLWSVFFGGNGIAQTRYILHTVNPARQYQMNIINIIASLALGIAPLIAGLFLKLTEDFGFGTPIVAGGHFNNYHLLFTISAALFICPHILRKGLGQKKDTPTAEVMVIVTRPLRGLFGPFIRIGTKKSVKKTRKRLDE